MRRRSRSSLNFELWRDTLRLEKSASENEALDILLRMATVKNSMGIIAEDKHYTPIEQLVDRYLPTPAMRVELLRRMPPRPVRRPGPARQCHGNNGSVRCARAIRRRAEPSLETVPTPQLIPATSGSIVRRSVG